jgi:hypothetical protein
LIVFHSFQHFFETSHAKGPQDAAGGFIRRQADIAVLRGNTIIQNANDLFSFCNNDLKEPNQTLHSNHMCINTIDRKLQFLRFWKYINDEFEDCLKLV